MNVCVLRISCALKSCVHVVIRNKMNTFRNGGKTLAHIGHELKTGDHVHLDADISKGTLSFVVNGR